MDFGQDLEVLGKWNPMDVFSLSFVGFMVVSGGIELDLVLGTVFLLR